jgi:hypothetical protein
LESWLGAHEFIDGLVEGADFFFEDLGESGFGSGGYGQSGDSEIHFQRSEKHGGSDVCANRGFHRLSDGGPLVGIQSERVQETLQII